MDTSVDRSPDAPTAQTPDVRSRADRGAGHGPSPRRTARRWTARVRRGLSLGAALVLMGIAALSTASAASAVGCYGDYCSGMDPHSTGCDADAVTVASIYIGGTFSPIELRWSPTCKTNWARVPAAWGTGSPNQLLATQKPTGYTQRGVVGSNESYAWTRMIYSPRMCVYAAWEGPPGTKSTVCA